MSQLPHDDQSWRLVPSVIEHLFKNPKDADAWEIRELCQRVQQAERHLAEKEAARKRWQQIADQRAIEVADLKTSAPSNALPIASYGPNAREDEGKIEDAQSPLARKWPCGECLYPVDCGTAKRCLDPEPREPQGERDK